MKAEDVKVGMEVYPVDDRHSQMTVDQLPDEDGNVVCRWSGGRSDSFHVDEIAVVDEEADKALAARVQVKINEAADAFEKAYEAFKAADEMGYETGLGIWELKYRKLLDMDKLEQTVEGAGWSMSSLMC